MCGIFGAFYLDRFLPSPEIINSVVDSMRKRGPDGRGIWYANSYDDQRLFLEERIAVEKDYHFILGHRRLSIIDLETGSQPMSNEDQSVWVCFNGEIYNHAEIKKELLKKGHQFRTDHSDTEVIIHSYEEWGTECLQWFRGMFAFGIFDVRKNELFIARDRIGVKPLYYYFDKSRFVFSSELKAIFQLNDFPLTISPTAVAEFFQFQYIPSPRSIFKEIWKLPPGNWMKISFVSDKLHIQMKSYWDLNFIPNYKKKKNEWIEELDSILSESIGLRLVSDVPVGVFLSGGIDSSTVLAYSSEKIQYPLHTFSIGSREETFNELPLARIMAEKYNTIHHERIIEPNIIEFIPILLAGFDEPFADSSALPTFHVSQLASEKVKVALSGDGGDEAFLGYQTYRLHKVTSIFDIFPSFLVRKILGTMGYLIGNGRRGSKFLNTVGLPYPVRHKEGISIFNSNMLRNLLKDDIQKQLSYPLYPEYDHCFNRQTWDSYSELQYADTKTYLPEDILTKVDRMSMSNSLEVREPLLDHKLLEFVATIPSHLKYKFLTQKYILKETVKSKLTKNHIQMPKRGFGIPLTNWFRNELREFVCNILKNRKLLSSEYLNKEYIFEIINDHQTGKRDYGPQIWSLLVFEFWLRFYLEKDSKLM